MPTVTLYIRQELADVFTAERLAPRVYKRLFDLENLGSRRGDKAINLKLPRTSRNSRLLGHIDSVETAGNFFANRSFEASIWADGASLIAGRLYVESITPDEFECSLIGGNIAWADALRGIRAQDLPLRCVRYSGAHSTAIAPILNQASQNTVSLYEIWQDGVESGNYDFALPLVGYGNFPCEPGNTDLNPINGVVAIEDSAGVVDGAILDNSQNNPLSIFDFIPAPYLRAVLRAAAKAAGYTADGDVFTDDFFKGICLPSTLERREIDAGFNLDLLSLATLTYNRSSSGVPQNAWAVLTSDSSPSDGAYLGNQLGTNTYTAAIAALNKASAVGPIDPAIVDSASGIANPSIGIDFPRTNINGLTHGLAVVRAATPSRFRVRFTATIRATIIQTPISRGLIALVRLAEDEAEDWNQNLPPDIPEAVAYIEQGTLPPAGGKIVAYQTFTLTNDNSRNDPIDIFADVEMPTGERIVPVAFCFYEDGSSLINAITLSGTTLKIEQSPQANTQLCPAAFLPDISAVELVRGIVEHFNLYIDVEPRSNTLFFNTRRTYFLGNDTAYDWTSKCSDKALTVRAPDWHKSIELRYAEEDDEPLFTAGQYDSIWQNESNYYTDELVRDSLFAATGIRRFVLYRQDAELSLNSLGNVDEYAKKLGELGTGEQSRRYDWTPRIVRYMGLAQDAPGPNATETAIWVDDLAIRATYVSGSTFTGDLILPYTRFDSPDTLSYANRPGGRRGLFVRFFEQEFEQVAQSVVVKVPVMLTGADVLELNVRRPVRIGQIYYIINEVEGFNPGDTVPTPVTLIRK